MADRDALQRAELALNDARATLEDAKQGFSDLAAWVVRGVPSRRGPTGRFTKGLSAAPERVITPEDAERVRLAGDDWLGRLQKDIDRLVVAVDEIQNAIGASRRSAVSSDAPAFIPPPPSITVNGMPADPATTRPPIEVLCKCGHPEGFHNVGGRCSPSCDCLGFGKVEPSPPPEALKVQQAETTESSPPRDRFKLIELD